MAPKTASEEASDLSEIEMVSADEADSLDAPPLPRQATVAPPTPLAVQTGQLPPDNVSGDDLEFVRRVFSQVRDVDFRAAPPPTPKGLSGPDKKLHDLREKIRRLERDLARVGFVWTSKQAQIESLDAILGSKEAERGAAVAAYEQIHEEANGASMAHQAEADALRETIAALTDAKVAIDGRLRQESTALRETQGRLILEEQEKAALIADFRAKMEAAQAAFNQLREQSARSIGALEAHLRQREQDLGLAQTAIAERDVHIATQRDQMSALEMELSRRITDAENRLAATILQLSQADEKLAARDQTIMSLAEKMTERERTTAQLAAEITQSRVDSEQRIHAAEAELAKLRADMAKPPPS